MLEAKTPPGRRFELERFYTTTELAALFKRSRSWIRREFGTMNVLRFSTRHMRIPESVVIRFMVEHGYEPNLISDKADAQNGN
jgi:hypothetical protein